MKIKEIKNLFFIYFIAHGLSLGFIDAQFYDDIFFFNWDKDVFISTVKQINEIFDYRLYIWLFLISFGPGIASLASFILFFFSAILFNRIVNSFYLIKKETGYLLTVLYLILPFGLIKFSFSMIPYLVCIIFFLLGWYFIIRSRILSLFFFFGSFNMQSLLVLYALPIITIFFYKKKKKIFFVKEFLFFLIKKIDFTILPFLFFFIKYFFYKANGYYENYNEVYDIRYVIVNPILQFLDLFRNNLSIGFLILGYLSAFFILKYFYSFLKNSTVKKKSNFNIAVVITGIIGSLFPYWIVGHIPTFVAYSSRHQLLLLISMPFFIIYLLNFLKNKYQKLILLLVLTLCLSINFKIYFDYYIDYLKQKKLIEYIIKNKNLFSDNNLIIMNDKIRSSTVIYGNNNNHIYSNAVFKRALQNEKNFVIEINELEDYSNGKFDNKFNGYYLASQHMRLNNNSIIMVTIESHGFLKFIFSHRKIFIN